MSGSSAFAWVNICRAFGIFETEGSFPIFLDRASSTDSTTTAIRCWTRLDNTELCCRMDSTVRTDNIVIKSATKAPQHRHKRYKALPPPQDFFYVIAELYQDGSSSNRNIIKEMFFIVVNRVFKALGICLK